MKKLLALLLPLVFVFGCDDGDNTQHVQLTQCSVSEAVVTFPSAELPTAETKEKYVVTYTETSATIAVYEADDGGKFDRNAARTISMAFDEADDGRLLEIIYSSYDPTTYISEKYSYLNDMDIVKQVTEVIEGEIAFQRSFTLHIPPQNAVGMYVMRNMLNEDVLYVFENNNLVKIGQQSEDGDVPFDNKKWRIVTTYEYDERPNAAKDIVIAMLTFGIDSPIRYSKNNVIRETHLLTDGTSERLYNSPTYTHDGMLATYYLESKQRNLTFEYDCQQ